MTTPLATYMEREKIGDADFAARIERDRTIVSKIRRGIIRPTLDVAAAIEVATKGELPMQIWVDVAPEQARAA